MLALQTSRMDLTMNELLLLCGYQRWVPTKDGDTRALALFRRHYSFHAYRDGRRENRSYRNRNLIVGPGEKIVLLTVDSAALFVWRKFINRDGQQGVNCAVFRNESQFRSSDLILEAETFAQDRWPGQRMYTYVNPLRIKSANPGYCFLVADWRRCGCTAKGLLILEKYP